MKRTPQPIKQQIIAAKMEKRERSSRWWRLQWQTSEYGRRWGWLKDIRHKCADWKSTTSKINSFNFQNQKSPTPSFTQQREIVYCNCIESNQKSALTPIFVLHIYLNRTCRAIFHHMVAASVTSVYVDIQSLMPIIWNIIWGPDKGLLAGETVLDFTYHCFELLLLLDFSVIHEAMVQTLGCNMETGDWTLNN